ncbi:hypothetical protein OTUT144_0487 [Orientia tsutsugamushi str. UT144]|uniref:Uncharacterized protein n=1 Tax=Orientia tsutsugamushi str. UT144 TaxID=1441384 RepID=A0A0F3RM94_ORITS|nr:hypothetical protein OTUT144_0487 [Orientia tsutsugamushi str. UT144]
MLIYREEYYLSRSELHPDSKDYKPRVSKSEEHMLPNACMS